jgi:large subunit ribosomal protein L25
MISDITIEAVPRPRLGKSAARQLRREEKIPVTLYGGDEPTPASLTVQKRDLVGIFRSASGRNTIFHLKVNGGVTPVIIKDWQRDPLKGALLHVDLMRIDMTKMTRVRVPVEVQGEAFGVKTQGGLLDFAAHELEVECLPVNIPDRIHIDVSELRVGDHISVKNLTLEEGVKVLADPDRVIVSVLAPRIEEVPTPTPVAGEITEPEVIKKGKAEKEEEEE